MSYWSPSSNSARVCDPMRRVSESSPTALIVPPDLHFAASSGGPPLPLVAAATAAHWIGSRPITQSPASDKRQPPPSVSEREQESAAVRQAASDAPRPSS